MRYSKRLSFALILPSWVAVVRSQNCQLQVPQNPLTAEGLATPYMLTGCNQLDFANQGAFVEAAILDPATGNIQIYSPLVINAGMTPVGNNTSGTPSGSSSSTVASPTTKPTSTKIPRQASSAGFYVPPIVPTLPTNPVVGIWFGSNAASLTLTGDTGSCVNGLGNSVFGQFAHCNGQAWFNAAKAAVSKGLTKLPPPGTGMSGQACPTTHDFRIVDQDQSDNVVTTYLLIGTDTLAQNTPNNNKANPDAEVLSNASDNALVTQFIDPALGCAPFQNPCTTCSTGQSPALATDELVATFFPPASGPALIPLNDPMVLVNGQQSLQKVNLYRDGTGQPQADNQNASAVAYCKQITQGGIFINDNQQLFSNAGSPATNQANNLFTFLAMRFSASFGPAPGLGCTGLLNIANPVALTMDGNGVVTAATINTQALQQILSGATGSSSSVSVPSLTATSATTSVTGMSTTKPSPSGVLLHPSSSLSSPSPTSTSTSTTTSSSVPSAASSSVQTSATTSGIGMSATKPSPNGVLLHPSSSLSSPSPTSTSSTSTTTSSSVPSAASSSVQTSATTSGTGMSATKPSPSGVRLYPSSSMSSPSPTNTNSTSTTTSSSVPSAASSSVQTPVPTGSFSLTTCPSAITVTVTATACPTLNQGSSVPTPSPTTSGGAGGGWNHGWHQGGHGWTRSGPFMSNRVHRKRRLASFA